MPEEKRFIQITFALGITLIVSGNINVYDYVNKFLPNLQMFSI